MAVLRKVIQRPYIATLTKIGFDRRQQERVDNGAYAARRQRTRVDATYSNVKHDELDMEKLLAGIRRR